MPLFPLLLTSVIVLATVHMIAPDHWLPITAISSIRKFSNARRSIYGFLLGTVHAITSAALAVAALTFGIFVTKNYLSYLYDAGVILLVVVGLYFISNGLLEKRKPRGVEVISSSSALTVSIFPDFALIPILIAGASLQALEMEIMITVFVLISAFSLSVVVLVTSTGISRAIGNLPPRYMDYVMGTILIITALLIRLV
jgi:putative Mn2+ efflux pump MntP